MKKTYISPSIMVVKINTEAMIAESLGKYDSGSDGSVLIKRDHSSRSSYSVWDDDWQNP